MVGSLHLTLASASPRRRELLARLGLAPDAVVPADIDETPLANETPAAWLERALARRAQLQDAHASVARDLKRWLPSSWPLGEAEVATMIQAAVTALDQAMDLMRPMLVIGDAAVRQGSTARAVGGDG